MNLYGLKDSSIEITSYIIRDDDPRHSPRIGKKHINIGDILVQILHEQGRPCGLDEIYTLAMKQIGGMKKWAIGGT